MGIGHNQGPTLIEFSQETCSSLGEWLKENPVVQNEDIARSGKLLVDRARACVIDMEAERDGKVRPLNDQVKKINDSYRTPRETLENITQELVLRLDAYRKAEEDRRTKAAEAARRIAEEAERRAREAEAREQEAKEDAATGVVVDVGTSIREADQAFREFQEAERAAARLQRDSTVRIGGGISRALSARTKETLTIVDVDGALVDMGVTLRITEAILTEAREFRKTHGRLPEGIKSNKERRL